MHNLLTQKAQIGLSSLQLDNDQKYIDRLAYELEIIGQLKFSSYFLVVQDFATWCKNHFKVVSPGRGSCAGSLLCYCLGITLVDPIQYNLKFERFLSLSRKDSWPDIDYDVIDRDQVISYIESKYGVDKVARIGSMNLLRTKSAVHGIGKAIEFDPKTVNYLANLVPKPQAGLWVSIDREIEIEPRLDTPEYAPIIGPIKRLWGNIRSFGTHAGGIVISPIPLIDIVPLHVDKEKKTVIQLDYRDVEKIGLIKYDILGLKTLRIVEQCLNYIEQTTDQTVDIYNIPKDDASTYELISSGNLDGIFQLGGSDAIKSLTVNMQPKSIEDLSLISALFRPGPLCVSKDTSILLSVGENNKTQTIEKLYSKFVSIPLTKRQQPNHFHMGVTSVTDDLALVRSTVRNIHYAGLKKVFQIRYRLDDLTLISNGKFTAGHHFKTLRGWIKVRDLTNQDSLFLYTKSGIKEVQFVEALYIGEEHGYDIELKGPEHNFIADNFVVHNSSGMVDSVIDVKQGKKDPSYIHPQLAPILQNSYGTCVFQEQVMQICVDICGYTLEEADVVRGILGKKKRDKMDLEKPKFIQGAIDHGWTNEQATQLWTMLEDYASYLFNASHSVAYSLVTYWCGYLKAHFPTEFYAALLACENDTDNITQFISSAREQNITVLGPDINRSDLNFSPENGSIRIGLNSIKGMPEQQALNIIAERKNGPFKSIENLIYRTDCNKNAIKALGLSGALSSIEEANELEAYDYGCRLLEYKKKLESYNDQIEKYNKKVIEQEEKYQEKLKLYELKENEKREAYNKKEAERLEEIQKIEAENQIAILNGKRIKKVPTFIRAYKQTEPPKFNNIKEPEKSEIPQIARIFLSQKDRVKQQREMINLYLSGHPLDTAIIPTNISFIRDIKSSASDDVKGTKFKSGDKVRIAAAYISCKEQTTKNKTVMGRLRFEDKTGGIEVVLFHNLYNRYRDSLVPDSPFLVEGIIDVTSFNDEEGNETRYVTVRGLVIEPLTIKEIGEWEIVLPLLKGQLKISPGENKSLAKSAIITAIQTFIRQETGSDIGPELS